MTDHDQLAKLIEWGLRGFEGFIDKFQEYCRSHELTVEQKKRLRVLADGLRAVAEEFGK